MYSISLYSKMSLSFNPEDLAQQLGDNYAVGHDGGGANFRILIWKADETNRCFDTALAFASCVWLLVHYNSSDPRAWSFSKKDSCKGTTVYGETLALSDAVNAFKKLLE